MIGSHRTTMFWDAGERTFRSDRVVLDETFLGVITAHYQFGARTTRMVADAIAACKPPRTRPLEVRDMLLACSSAIERGNAAPGDSTGCASIVLVWQNAGERVEIAHCGGGHVLLLRDGAVSMLMESQTVERLAREQGGVPPGPRDASIVTSMLGAPSPQVELASHAWLEGDRIVVVSASCDLATTTLIDIVRMAAPDFATIAGNVGRELLLRSPARGVTVIALELRSGS